MPTGLDLKVARVRARLTVTEVADAMGVSRQRVSQVEAMALVNASLEGRYRAALQVAEDRKNTEAVA